MSTTTMDAKTAILARARDAISRSQQDRPVRPIPRDYIRSTEHAPGSDAVVEEMIETLEDYSAQVVVVSSEDEAADAVSKFLADKEATSVVVPSGLDDVFKKAAARDGRTVREDSREQAIATLDLDKIDAVVTRCRVAISLSGTIVLDGEPDQGRRAITLVPDTHVVVLRASDIVPTEPDPSDDLARRRFGDVRHRAGPRQRRAWPPLPAGRHRQVI